MGSALARYGLLYLLSVQEDEQERKEEEEGAEVGEEGSRPGAD